MKFSLLSIFSTLLSVLTLASAAPLEPRQGYGSIATYSPGTFAVSGDSNPFLVYNGGAEYVIQWYFQTDGNFVVYQANTTDNTRFVQWSSNTAGHDCSGTSCQLNFQSDGNLVIYVGGGAIWASNTDPASHNGVGGQSLIFYPLRLGHLSFARIEDRNGNNLWGTGFTGTCVVGSIGCCAGLPC